MSIGEGRIKRSRQEVRLGRLMANVRLSMVTSQILGRRQNPIASSKRNVDLQTCLVCLTTERTEKLPHFLRCFVIIQNISELLQDIASFARLTEASCMQKLLVITGT